MMAAPPPALGPPQPCQPEDTFLRLCALLRDVRAEAQNLQGSLAVLQQKSLLTDQKTRAQEVETAVKDATGVLARNRSVIDQRLAEIRSLFQLDATQYDWCGDEVTEVENNWERAVTNWPSHAQPADDVLRRITGIDACLDQIVFHCASLTIPRRLDAYLDNLRVGQTLDFHSAFEDELPKREQRQRVLEDLARQPGVVSGVIDAPSGLIYRASPSGWRRRASAFLLTAFAAIGFLAVWLFSIAGDSLSLAGWPVKAKQFPELAIGYLFLVLGGIAHVGVNALKESRAGKSRFSVLDDWILWLHVRESSVLWAILYLWAGFLFLASTLHGLNWQTAFFAGYSIDSVVDLFLERFQKFATAQTADLAQKVKET
jgi:hypothetical protein